MSGNLFTILIEGFCLKLYPDFYFELLYNHQIVPNAASIVIAVTKFGSIPRFKLCIPAPQEKPVKYPSMTHPLSFLRIKAHPSAEYYQVLGLFYFLSV